MQAGTGPAQLIKEKLEIVEFLRGYLTLTQAGRNFKANCPFHKEKTPSFMVSPDRQSWHCFGCGLGGDIFTFIMRHENVEFGEALKILADKAGIELKRASPMDYQYFGLLYDLNEAAKDFFKVQLANSKPAQEYLKSRGLKEETIKEFELGWAPAEPEGLSLHFINLGYSPEQITRAGLSIKTERGMQLDRFRGRIMFPIHNHLGKVVGFTGRILPVFDKGEMGKYVNSPETAIFAKSKLLYGFWKSKQHVRDMNEAFLVEGQMDMLMSWQAGIKNAVASSGTALTEDHLGALKRFADRLVISFDSDEAGWSAAERAIDLAEKNDFNVKVADLGQFKDPAEAAEKEPEKLLSAVKEAKPAIRAYFEKYFPEPGKSGEMNFAEREPLRKLRIVLAKIQNIISPVERSFWIAELARYTNLRENDLLEEAQKIEARIAEIQFKKEELPASKKILGRREILSRDLLSAAMASGDWKSLETHSPYMTETCAKAYKIFAGGGKGSEDQELDSLMHEITLSSETIPIPEMEDLKNFLRNEYLKEKRQELAETIRAAEIKGDEAATEAALKELSELPAI